MATATAKRSETSQIRALRSIRPAPTSSPREREAPTGVVAQVRAALHPRARLATLLGCILGGFVPLASYVVAHGEIDATVPLYAQVSTLLVLGGLLFSAKTVYTWARAAFDSPAKALGFVVLVEGCLTLSRTHWLGLAALALLVAVNGVATGVTLSVGSKR